MKSLSKIGLVCGAMLGLGGATLAACGGGDQGSAGSFGGNGGSSGSHATKSNGTASANGGGTGEGGFNPVGPGPGPSSSGAGGGPSCGGTASTAEPIPLDIYIMLDKSGSMNDVVSGGMTKWDNVSTALDGFFADPASQGLDVGIQFFPLEKANLPAGCTTNAQCNAANAGPCILDICQNATTLVACTTNADCAGNTGPCAKIFRCTSDPNPGDFYLCTAAGQGCQAPDGTVGTCANFTAQNPSQCANPDYCTVTQYATPAQEIGALTQAQINALDAAVMAESPQGATPTSAALSGAISHAQSWATANPTHTVIVVFATDGLPTECSPTDIPSIAQIAAMGASGSPAVKTYVIGVLSAADIAAGADTNLQTIATSGQGQAFIINSSNQNVEMQFVQAMNQIRAAKLACEYAVPPPPDGGTQDYGKVNVEYTPPGQSMAETIGYVGSMANCDPMTGGWYYDHDPAMGGTPTKIIMCPATCNDFMNGGKVDIRVGCKTKIQPPPH